ncbi:fatty acid oxidation complex subunit alpha [Striga asiatica]|uniref:Fatty acid oxidation complex subunit alpha n=1 Tax=Striga asiatica TaxID=4170 RepID=A0A5A7PQQ3_STRAF|nr:fatty acid oxidation complex subunit alpha [Striga asiatica]
MSNVYIPDEDFICEGLGPNMSILAFFRERPIGLLDSLLSSKILQYLWKFPTVDKLYRHSYASCLSLDRMKDKEKSGVSANFEGKETGKGTFESDTCEKD